MLNPLFEKAVAIVLLLLLPATFLFSQTSPEELFPTPETVKSEYTVAQGRIEGERDAKGNPAYACGGAACGVFGFIFAALSDPKPPAHVMLELEETKGESYAMGYEMAYSKKSKSRNMVYAGVGWVVGAAISFAILINDAPQDDDYKK
jgi:hypothetical protein